MNHKENRVFKFALSIVCLLVVILGQASAGPIVTVPTSLSPGDSYRLAFLTSDTIDSTSTDIDVYNTFVDGLGDTVIASDWRAIASTATVDARDNTGTNPIDVGVPIFLLNDTRLAADNYDLWGAELIPDGLHYTDVGVSSASYVWTGSLSYGVAHDVYHLGTSSGYRMMGFSQFGDMWWISHSPLSAPHFFPSGAPMYAMSGLLAVPAAVVPEPSSLMLLGIGAVGLLGYRLHRKGNLSPTSS